MLERRDGVRRLYRANVAEVQRVRQYLEEYWTESLQRLRQVAETAEREKGLTHG